MKAAQQGEIYLADLNPVKGHEQGGYRPVLLLQNDRLNKNLNTVVIAPITRNLAAKGYLTTFFLAKKVSRLKFDSVALLYQVRVLDKRRLKKMVSRLNPETLGEVRRQLMLIF